MAGSEGGQRDASRDIPAPPKDAPQAAVGNDSKYVVWSSAPTEIHRSVPEE
jgi:hypothetical protein